MLMTLYGLNYYIKQQEYRTGNKFGTSGKYTVCGENMVKDIMVSGIRQDKKLKNVMYGNKCNIVLV